MTQATMQDKSVGQSPVDDATYNLMQALTSKLEAIEAYETYRQDGDDTDRQLFEDLLREERQHADRLLAALRNRMR
jgi:rubrerythrin